MHDGPAGSRLDMRPRWLVSTGDDAAGGRRTGANSRAAAFERSVYHRAAWACMDLLTRRLVSSWDDAAWWRNARGAGATTAVAFGLYERAAWT